MRRALGRSLWGEPSPWRTARAARAALGAVVALVASAHAGTADAAGTWTKAPIQPTNGAAFGLWLLTDGTVLSHGNALNHWVKLTPDKTGSYANGTWTQLASSAYARGGAQEHVLKDGRFFEAGGEFIYVYPGCASNCAQPANGSPLFKNVEIYDPVANTWTIEASGLFDIGDTGSATLSDGRILDSTRVSGQGQIYDPVANTWTMGATSPIGSGDENSWASLQNGGVLAVAPMGAAVYNPQTNAWVRTGALPAGLTVTLPTFGAIEFGDVAGISLMFDGRVLAYGLGTTAIYTPGPTASSPGTWALGPNLLTGAITTVEPGNEAEDEYTVTEPNGKVMVATYPFQGSPNLLQEFDPTTNTFASIPPPPDPQGPYPVSYLNLPNGQLMITAGSQDWLYTPDSEPQDGWRPTVTSVVFNGGNSYTLTGTQLSGLINGGDEGDDMTMAENYPIVWLKDASGNVFFCKSSNFSNMMPSKGPTPETATFTTPAGLPAGTYSLFVSAVGVQSKDAVPFTVGASIVVDGGAGSEPIDAGVDATTGGKPDAGKSADASAEGDASGSATTGSATGGTTSGSGSTGSGSTGSGSTGSGGSTTSGTASGNSGATASGSSSGEGGTANGANSPGCGCSAVGVPADRFTWTALLGLVGLAIGRTRRRRHRAGAQTQ